jgi:hypothetical protein
MNRRSFLQGLSALVGGVAIEQAIPFNRVWSFPKNIVIPNRYQIVDRKLTGVVSFTESELNAAVRMTASERLAAISEIIKKEYAIPMAEHYRNRPSIHAQVQISGSSEIYSLF